MTDAFCSNFQNGADCESAAGPICMWYSSHEECNVTTTTTDGPTFEPTEESGCCTGSTLETSPFCVTLMNSEDCLDPELEDVCTWIVTEDPSECELTTTETPSVEPTATPSAWIEGCCSGIDNIDDSWCAQFENGPDCEANPQCWWIDGGMRFPIFIEADNAEINMTTQSPTVSPTDPTAFPSQIPTRAPSKTPTWSVMCDLATVTCSVKSSICSSRSNSCLF